MSKNLLPIVLALIDIAAAVVCVCKHDYIRAWYWFAAANITGATICMKG